MTQSSKTWSAPPPVVLSHPTSGEVALEDIYQRQRQLFDALDATQKSLRDLEHLLDQLVPTSRDALSTANDASPSTHDHDSDYAAAAHASTHNSGGADELNHDNLAGFAANEHFTEASIDHTAITNIGTNTHAQIDTHIANGDIHQDKDSVNIDGGTIDGVTIGATTPPSVTANDLKCDTFAMNNQTPQAQQAHIADASTSHSTASFGDVNTALDALGTKINSILSALETFEFLADT